MPPKRKENEKARIALERKVERLREIEIAKAKAIEDAKWVDEGSTIKEQRAAERAARQAEKERREAQKRELYAADVAAASTVKLAPSAKKAVRELNKVTQFAIAQAKMIEERRLRELVEAKERAADRMIDLPEIKPNLNQMQREAKEADEAKFGQGNVIHASGLENVMSALSVDSESTGAVSKHPEKRRKKAFKEFEADRLPVLRAAHPTLRYSQVHEILWKEWQSHPDNPMNEQQ